MAVARARILRRLDAMRGGGGDGDIAAVSVPLVSGLPEAKVAQSVAPQGPPAVQRWAEQAEAELDAQLARIRIAESRLQQIDADLAQLDRVIESAKALEPAPSSAVASSEEERGETYDCPSCNHAFPAAKLTKHMSVCYVKREKGTLFGSTISPGPIIYGQLLFCCALISAKSKTYCRRLRFSCPLHGGPMSSKQQKKDDQQQPNAAPSVCGYPRAEGDLCCQLAGKCDLHSNWAALWRSQLHQSRQSVLVVLDELRTEADSFTRTRDRARAALLLLEQQKGRA
jgi:hypothetical protein